MKARFLVSIPALLAVAALAGQPQMTTVKTLKISPEILQRAVKPPTEATRQAASAARDMNGWGPGAGIQLGDVVQVSQLDRFGLEMRDLCRLSLEVYRDANADSGIFYYRPTRYALRFDPEEGYFLTVDYKGAGESGKNVLIQARLTSGAGPVDLEVLRALLRRYAAGRDPILLRLPATYEARFDLTSFGVDAVTVSGIDTDTGEVVISFATGVETKELLTSALGNVNGLVGQVTLRPAAVSEQQTFRSAIDISAEIKMADVASGPRMLWRARTATAGSVANPWPFPLTLHSLCYLLREPTGALRLRGFSLGETLLAPGDTARIDAAKLNSEIDSPAAVAAFYDASLVREDEAVRRTVEELTGGVGALPVHELWVEVVKPQELFQQYSVYKVAVEVRSLYFDPQARAAVNNTYELDESTAKVQCAPLYFRGTPGADFYQYKLGIVTLDGAVHADARWRGPNPTLINRIFIGAAMVEEVLGR
ncbi:MAG: hypothetical protein V1750_02170 [Acidobacteriota bacterium]